MKRKKSFKSSGRGAKTAESAYSGRRVEIEVLLVIGVVLAALLLVSPAMAQDGEAKVRMIHLSPDAPSVMVELDGEPVEALADVSYRDATPYLPIPAGPHDVAVYAAADPSEPVLEVSIAPEAGESYTIAGVGLLEDETFGARLFQDDAETVEDKAKVRVIHAVPDVGPATVSVQDGPDLFTLPGFANASDYAEVDAGTYTLEVTPAGAEEPAFDVPDVEVENGEIYTAFAIGQASEGTLDTLLTVDSDDGRIVGPKTLKDTSGDLSLLQKPQAVNVANFTPTPPPDKDSKKSDEKQRDSSNEEQETGKPSDKETPGGDPSAKAPSDEPPTEESGDSGASPTTAPATQSEAPPVWSEPYVAYTEPVGSAAPAETPSVVPAAAPTYQAPHQAPELQASPPEPVVVPGVDEVVADTLARTGISGTQFADSGFVEAPVEPVIAPPAAPTPSAPNVAVEVPPVSTQPVARPVTQSGFVPPVPSSQGVVDQSLVTQQTVIQNTVVQNAAPSSGPSAPAENVVGIFINTPAIVNSGARRRFVTIRQDRLR